MFRGVLCGCLGFSCFSIWEKTLGVQSHTLNASKRTHPEPEMTSKRLIIKTKSAPYWRVCRELCQWCLMSSQLCTHRKRGHFRVTLSSLECKTLTFPSSTLSLPGCLPRGTLKTAGKDAGRGSAERLSAAARAKASMADGRGCKREHASRNKTFRSHEWPLASTFRTERMRPGPRNFKEIRWNKLNAWETILKWILWCFWQQTPLERKRCTMVGKHEYDMGSGHWRTSTPDSLVYPMFQGSSSLYKEVYSSNWSFSAFVSSLSGGSPMSHI